MMKVSGILKLTGLYFSLFTAGSMVLGCKNDKTGEYTDEVQKELIDNNARNTLEIKAELVGNY